MKISLLGVDTGGTFTDVLAWEGERLHARKVPSTPDDPARAVIEALSALAGELLGAIPVVYGTTVATNAVLERRGAATALITTEGFEDVLELGRQDRPDIYALHPSRPEPIVPAERRFGVRERLGPTGAVETALSPEEAEAAARRVLACGAESVAICLLHSYANGAHEEALGAALERVGFDGPIALSHRVLPEHRELERTATTCAQAYVAPKVDAHVARLEAELGGARLLIMQSNGGSLAASEARAEAVRTVLSGPVGGVIGAGAVATAAGYPGVITFDMGGTSTDVSLWSGGPTWTNEAEVGGIPIRMPMLDIHTVGAGGGSVARRDPGGALTVGPESAGARPGPACYGLGGRQPTVTDAHVVLGRLVPDRFLGGEMRLAQDPARDAVGRLASDLGLGLEEAAAGILRVADATMERAIKVISLERGHDPRSLALLSFGGAGGLHAASLAESMGMATVIVPPNPGLLSAFGMLQADIVRDHSRGLLLRIPPGVALPPDRIPSVDRVFAELRDTARAGLLAMGVPGERITLTSEVDFRYQGQSHEIRVPLTDAVNRFHEAHAALYGYRHSHRPLELVTLRLRATGHTDKPPVQRHRVGRRAPAPEALVDPSSAAWWAGGRLPSPTYERDALRPGNRIAGPALVCEYSATTAVPPGWQARVDERLNLVLTAPTG